MSKSILLLAAVFAVTLSLSACSGGGDGNLNCKLPNGNCIKTSEDDCYAADGVIGQCQAQNYNGYCVDRDYYVCILATEQECQLIIDYLARYGEYSTSFLRTCPSGYDSSPKACYDGWGCGIIGYGDFYSENDCLRKGYQPMDLGTCERTYGIWAPQGSCTVSGQCYDDISQSDCSSARGSFVLNGTCPHIGGNNYGSCTLPGYACIENLSRYECDESDGQVFVSNGTCSTTSFPYCANYGDCDRIGGSYISSKSECFYEDGFLANLKFCQENGFDIEGIDY